MSHRSPVSLAAAFRALLTRPAVTLVTAWVATGVAGAQVALDRAWRPLGPPVTQGPASDPRVAVDALGRVVVAYEDCVAPGACGQLTVAQYEPQSNTWVPLGGRFGASAGRSFFHTVAFDAAHTPYVASLDYGAPTLSHGPRGLNVRRFELASTTWAALGAPAQSEGEVHCTDVAVTPDGDVLVAFKDGLARVVNGVRVVEGHLGRTSILRFHEGAAGAWSSQYLGGPGFSGGRETWHHNVEVDPSGVIWAAWRDESFGRRAVVARYDALRDLWEPAGTPGFTAGDAGNLGLALDRLGRPHVVYFTSTHLELLRLERGPSLASSTWVAAAPPVALGDQPHFSYREWAPLAFDADNRPWVAYHADSPSAGGVVHVRCYVEEQGEWVLVGAPGGHGGVVGPSAGPADFVTLALGPQDSVAVAFRDLSAAQGGIAPLVVMTQ